MLESMPAREKEPLKPIHIRAGKAMVEELDREMRRTGLSRTALLKIAWRQYMDAQSAPKQQK
jgi:hypothetical protein